MGGGGQGGQMKVERVMGALFAVSGSWRPWNCRQSTESGVCSGARGMGAGQEVKERPRKPKTAVGL